jgi:hypothetical protein
MSTLSKHFRADNRPDQLTFSRAPLSSTSSRRTTQPQVPGDVSVAPPHEQPRLESL